MSSDRYRYWRREAGSSPTSTPAPRLPRGAVENWGHDFNIGAVVRTANAFLAPARSTSSAAGAGTGAGPMVDRPATSTYATIADTAQLTAWAAAEGLPIIGIDNLPGAVPLERTALPRRCVLLFGQEGPGLHRGGCATTRRWCAPIAQFGSTRSINAGAAAATRHARLGSSRSTRHIPAPPAPLTWTGRPRPWAPGRPCQAGRRTSTTRKRLATNAASHSAAFAAGLPPEPWKSEKAAVWFTYTPPVRFSESCARLLQADLLDRRSDLRPRSCTRRPSSRPCRGRCAAAAPARPPSSPRRRRTRPGRSTRRDTAPPPLTRRRPGLLPGGRPAFTIAGVRTTASGKSGWVTSREASATSPEAAAASRRAFTSGLTRAPSSAFARASSPSSRSTAAARSATTSSYDFAARVGGDAVPRDQQVLRGGAHLAAVEGQREGEVGEHAPVVVGGVDDDGVDAGLLGVDLRLAGVGLQPVAERGGARVVDDPDLGAHGQRLGDALAGALHGQRDQIRVEAGLGEHLAGHLHRQRQRQHRARMRLDQHRVAGGQGGEQARVAVPRREGVAADEQRDRRAGRP